jgi:ribonuclease BN (tRNA processing enzyme)
MKFLFLGSGSAFTIGADNFQSNMLFTSESGKKFLIDCGTDIRFSLCEANFSYSDITDIYISHLHSDHVGGLEYIGFSTKFDPQCEKPNLYLSQDIAVELWHKSLAGGMEAIEGELAILETFFRVHPL